MSPRLGWLGWAGAVVFGLFLAVGDAVTEENDSVWVQILVVALIFAVPIEMLRVDAIKEARKRK